MQPDKKIYGHAAALVTIAIWGATFISTKVLLRGFTPLEILFFRFCIGALALLLASPTRFVPFQKRGEWLFAAAGVSGVTLYFLLENIALTYTTASNVGVIVSVAPLFTALLARRIAKTERPGARFYVGLCTALAGVVLITVNGAAALQLNPLGDILALLSALLWAVYSLLVRKIGALGYPTIPVTRRIFAYGILFMLPALLFMDFKLDFTRFTQPVYLFNILFLGLGASALCFVTWNFAVQKLGAVKTSVYIYLVPVITVLLSVLILQEAIALVSGAGIALALAGLVISQKPNTRNK